MTSMVERVARAISKQEGCGGSIADCAACLGDHSASCLNVARAAVAAMREPTEAMTQAATMLAPTWDADASRAKWQAMIDAALAEHVQAPAESCKATPSSSEGRGK